MKGMSRGLLTGVLMLFVAGCSDSKPAPAPVNTPAVPAPANPAVKPAEEAFIASGPLVVENQVDVAALREGVVAEIFIDVGAAVRKGQLLAKLDDRQLWSDVEMGRARIAQIGANVQNWEAEVKVLEADKERAEKMWEAQLITKQDVDHARFKLVATEFELQREREALKSVSAQARSLELELAKTQVVAPFSGVVARRYVRVGQKVAVGDRLFWVTEVAPLRVKFALPEQFLGKLQARSEITVSPASSPESKYAARVIHVSPVVDPASGTIEVLAQLVGTVEGLRPGMMVNIQLTASP